MKLPYNILKVFLLAVLVASCKKEVDQTENAGSDSYFTNDSEPVQTGGIKMIEIATPKGGFKVWTKRIGNNPKIKVLLLNGGPGATHEYFECFESFLPAEGIEFIYYDQLGTGFSDNPNDVAMWDLPRYVEEVEQVRKALNLTADNFYLLGHSWGGILAMEYALKYQQNLKGLIISNMMSSAPLYGKYANEVLAKQMDPGVLASIRDIEARKDFENPKYMELLMPNFYAKHICKIYPFPEPVSRSFSRMNTSLYVTMQGPSEFGISGKLTPWDVSKRLPEIGVRTLVIGAKDDTMDPEHMKWMATQVKTGTYLHCPNGSHMAFYDDQKTYFDGLIKFLKQNDNN